MFTSSNFLLKFNPNGLLQFKKLFLQVKPVLPSEAFYLHLTIDPPRILFLSSSSEKERSFCYLQLSDELFINEIEGNSPECLLKISDSSSFSKFIRILSEKSSSFSLACSQFEMTLIYSEGSEMRTLNLEVADENVPLIEKGFPLNICLAANVKTSDFLRMADLASRTEANFSITIILKGKELQIDLEMKSPFCMRVNKIGVKIGYFSKNCPEVFEKCFVLDKARSKILMLICNIEEDTTLGLTENKDLFFKFMREGGENQEKMYEIGFLVPYMDDLEEKIKIEMEEEPNEEEKGNEKEVSEGNTQDENYAEKYNNRNDEEEEQSLTSKSNIY